MLLKKLKNTYSQEIKEAYKECANITRESSTNFYYGFLTLPMEKRNAIYATYAFCRLCDDVVDNPSIKTNTVEKLQNIRRMLNDCYAGNPKGHIWIALSDSQKRFGITLNHFISVIDGCEMDLKKNRYETFDELIEYCKLVASAVGLICIEICGYKNIEAITHAIDLGIAMQLTNVIRDVEEDLNYGRIYLPQEDLRRFEYSENDFTTRLINDNFKNMIRFQVDRAFHYFEKGQKLFPLLDRKSKICPESMAKVYLSLLESVQKADYDVLNNRVSLTRTAKFMLVAKLWLRSRIPLFE